MEASAGREPHSREQPHPCDRGAGKVDPGRQLEVQVDKLFSEFQLEDEWIATIMEYHLGESDLRAALRTSHSIQARVKRADDLYIDVELDHRKYSKTKRESATELLSVSVPDADDTLQARELLVDFGTLWLEISVNRKNRLLRQVLDGIYVNLDTRKVVAVQPKDIFKKKMLTIAEKVGITVLRDSPS